MQSAIQFLSVLEDTIQQFKKLSNSQHNKLKSAIKNKTEVVLRLSSNMIGDHETNFPHKLLLTNKQVANYLSTDIKLSKLNYLR